MECKYRPTDNARSILSPAYRILPVQTTRPLAVPYVGVTSNRGVMESRNGSKLERKLHDLRGCVCVASYPEGRKEGSKTWLTVDHRSHQDTSSLPPSLFLSLRFTDRGTPPPSIILLSRETPLSLSFSYPVLARPGGEKAFSIAVGTKLWSRNCAKQGKTKRRKNPAPVQTRAEGSNATKVFPLFLFPFCPSRTRHLLVITPVESSRLLARFSN